MLRRNVWELKFDPSFIPCCEKKSRKYFKVPMQSNKCENHKLWCRWTAWCPMTRTMTVSTNLLGQFLSNDSKPKETFGLVRQVQLSLKSCVFSTRHVKCLMIMFHAAIQQLSPMARETKCPDLTLGVSLSSQLRGVSKPLLPPTTISYNIFLLFEGSNEQNKPGVHSIYIYLYINAIILHPLINNHIFKPV